jgi:hypothetical protein
MVMINNYEYIVGFVPKHIRRKEYQAACVDLLRLEKQDNFDEL